MSKTIFPVDIGIRCAYIEPGVEQCRNRVKEFRNYCPAHLQMVLDDMKSTLGERKQQQQRKKYVRFENFDEIVASKGRSITKGMTMDMYGKHYEVEQYLGHGAYGFTLLVKSSGKMYAMKIELLKITEEDLCAEADMQKRVGKLVPETPIVDMCDRIYDEHHNMHMFTVMELMQGDCQALVNEIYIQLSNIRDSKTVGSFLVRDICVILYICMELARQVDILERNGIYHMDMKPANMLYSFEKDVNGRDRFRVALSDYGLACDTGPMYECFRASSYTPPEWKDKKVYNTGVRNREEIQLAQRYMVGATIYYIFTENGIDVGKTKKISIMEYYNNPQDFATLIRMTLVMTSPEPQYRQRVTYGDIVSFCERLIRDFGRQYPTYLSDIIYSMDVPYVRRS